MSGPKRTSREIAETLERLRREISGAPEPPPSGVQEPPPSKRRRRRARGKPRGKEVRGPAGAAQPREEPSTPSAPAPDSPIPAPSSGEDSAHESSASAPARGANGARSGRTSLSSDSVRVGDQRAVDRVVSDLLTHRRRGRGRILGVAGLPRHGKTTLADRLRERAAERPGADLRYNKTERGEINCYYIPGRRSHHALIDLAGEDYRVLGDYDRELPQLLEAFLWPVLQKLDGLVLLMALPLVWAGWNEDGRGERAAPDEAERAAMAEATRRMLDAHRMLLKYAIVARDLRRLRRRLPALGLSRDTPPDRNQVDDAFKQARPYDRPVSLVLSKADLFVGQGRPCLHTPNLPRLDHRVPLGIRPAVSDPLLVAAGHFPDFLDFLRLQIRHFKWSFCQALEDRSDRPSPLEAAPGRSDVTSLIGGEGVLDFLTAHPWRFPGIDADRAIRWDQRLRREAWEAARLGGSGA
ncbi:MAG: hypothetical protein HKO53_07930 [Gemmatimonadetes bacterium]|nr:hypothetical protein [Gemmatimonadota bacterium]